MLSVLLLLTMLSLSVNVPLLEMPPPKFRVSLIVTPLSFTANPALIAKTLPAFKAPLIDGGRCSTARDGEIPSDNQFSAYYSGQQVSVRRQDDRIIPCQSVRLLNRCA